MKKQLFSDQLETWLKSKDSKTLGDLNKVFGKNTFAIGVLLLMFLPALPLPTGGITHVFEIITMLLGLEMVIGLHTVWLPRRWTQIELGGSALHKAVPFISKRIRWFERYSHRRMAGVVADRQFMRLAGIAIIAFAAGAFFAPPFSGLDTVPALGAVAISLSLILEDIALFIIGCIVGVSGIILEATIGVALVEVLKKLLKI